MATESPLIHDGSQNTLSTANDARRSSITGSTLNGPNGSGQFLVGVLSTTVDRTVSIASTAPGTTPQSPYGVIQNTPGPGQGVDVGILGITKVVAGSTGFVRGAVLSPSTLSAGTVAAWATGQAYLPIGLALETPTAALQVITMAVGFGRLGGSS